MSKLLNMVDTIRKPVTARVVYVTDFKVLKKSRVDKTLTPDRLQGLKRIVTRVVNIANDYTEAVENQLAKSIKKEFPILSSTEAKTASGNIWTTDPHKYAEVDNAYPSCNVYQHAKEHDKKYIKIFEDMSSKLKEGALFNPQTGEIVEVTWQELCTYADPDPSKTGSKKQAEVGVEKEVKFRLVSEDNVKYLRCGDLEYDALTTIEKELLEKIKK